MKILTKNHILAMLVLALIALCVDSIYSPVAFDGELRRREKAVKERLVTIRRAEEAFKKVHGTYAADLGVLVANRLMPDSVQYIPYTERKKFEVSTTVFVGKSGRGIPLMECGAKYMDYMSDTDENAVAELIEKADNRGDYPGLRIGDITKPNNNAGNWE